MTTTDTAADFSTLQLDVPEGVQSISITRDFAASPDKVFRAHIDPELFVKWCGPDSITNTIREWNATTGGNWSYVSSDDRGEYAFFGSFHEVRENERIVQTFTFEVPTRSTSRSHSPTSGRADTVDVDLDLRLARIRDGMVASGMDTASSRATTTRPPPDPITDVRLATWREVADAVR